MAHQKPTTRHAILVELKTNGNQTAQNLATKLGISPVAVRKHLDGLETDGLIACGLQHSAMGRPAYVYSLTEAAEEVFPQGYRQLANDLLDTITETEGAQKVISLLQRRDERMTQTYKDRLDTTNTLPQRTAELARIRNEEGYMATAVTDGDQITLIEHHCPLRGVAQSHDEICNNEQALFTQLLGTPVNRTASMLNGAPVCCFSLEEKKVTSS